ncbi:MAG: beta-ketoacyl-[acyl-carrier-protein] synthase family protein [Deltaproteobacteria bacterium]|nr:beta-ketoacyl-[acyl-carrier-protein] synthase family protein [Deltaproteobacteria bacterium]
MGVFCDILGYEVVTALGVGLAPAWQKILAGESGIRPLIRLAGLDLATTCAAEIVPQDWAQVGGGHPPEDLWRAHGLALYAGREALAAARRAGLPPETPVGLVLATTKGEIASLLALMAGKHTNLHHLPGRLARDLAQDLELKGAVLAVSNACASGLTALATAARLIISGRESAMLVVGVDTLSRFILEGFGALKALDPNPCRPFDHARRGLTLGEGAGAVLLAAPGLGSAAARLTGWASTNDANHLTGPARDGEGLRRAMARALAKAGLVPNDVDYINAHGTGTPYNDEMETQALHALFGAESPPVNSLKSYLGHTLGAAGVIETVFCVQALGEGVVPASLGYLNHGVSLPLMVARENLDLPGMQRVLTVKSGFGGVNAALVLEKAEAS